MFRYFLAFGLTLSLVAPMAAQAAGCDARMKQAHTAQMKRLHAQAVKIKATIKGAAAGPKVEQLYYGYIRSLTSRGANPKLMSCSLELLSDAAAVVQKESQVAVVKPTPTKPTPTKPTPVPPKPAPQAGLGVKIFPGTMQLQRRKVIAPPQKIRHGAAFGYGFWINPRRPLPAWSSILHKGGTDKQRAPAFFFHPKTTRLHVRVDTAKKLNEGCDGKGNLPLGRWTHVFAQFRPGLAELYVNGKLRNRCRLTGPIRMNGGPLAAGDPWYAPAMAGIRDVRLFTRPLTPPQVMSLMKPGS